MYKYRRDVQRLILMDKEEMKAINLFNTSLAQVIYSKITYRRNIYIYIYMIYHHEYILKNIFEIIAN